MPLCTTSGAPIQPATIAQPPLFPGMYFVTKSFGFFKNVGQVERALFFRDVAIIYYIKAFG